MNIYRLLALYRDARAVARGRYPQRLVRRVIYGRAFRLAGLLSRLLGVSR